MAFHEEADFRKMVSICHLEGCKKAAAGGELTPGAEAYVGRNYGDPIRFVIVAQGARAREMISCGYVSKRERQEEIEGRIPHDFSWRGADVRSWILDQLRE